jgi:hypothetical protein
MKTTTIRKLDQTPWDTSTPIWVIQHHPGATFYTGHSFSWQFQRAKLYCDRKLAEADAKALYPGLATEAIARIRELEPGELAQLEALLAQCDADAFERLPFFKAKPAEVVSATLLFEARQSTR